MRRLSKVVWSEGMHLAQHHFQTQSRYFESAIQFALSHLFYKPYGVAGCDLDADALRNDTVAVLHARGIMPDGLAFNFPEGDAAPAPRHIREAFSPTQESHVVLLAVPAYRDAGRNCAQPQNGADARYTPETVAVMDEATGRDEKPVSLGRKNFRLALDTELEEGEVALPLARVRRDGAGHFAYDAGFVPPCLQIGASARLMELLRELVEHLDAKSDAMSVQRRAAGRSATDYAAHEVASFWLSHAIRSSLAPLRFHLQARRTRPEQLYTELARLGGALCTFALDSHPRALPAYDHDDLQGCFDALDRHIRAHLEIVIPTNCVEIPLRASSAYLYTGAVADARCFGRARWILSVGSSAGEADVVERVPRLVKVCSAKFTPELVRRAFPGLELEHLPVPPAAVSPRAGRQYFGISRSGPCWDTLVQTKEVGVYVPDAIPSVEVELLVVVDA